MIILQFVFMFVTNMPQIHPDKSVWCLNHGFNSELCLQPIDKPVYIVSNASLGMKLAKLEVAKSER